MDFRDVMSVAILHEGEKLKKAAKVGAGAAALGAAGYAAYKNKEELGDMAEKGKQAVKSGYRSVRDKIMGGGAPKPVSDPSHVAGRAANASADKYEAARNAAVNVGKSNVDDIAKPGADSGSATKKAFEKVVKPKISSPQQTGLGGR